MANFEDILRDSAQRTAKKENAHLDVPKCPAINRRTYWGWVATPVAAVAGVVLGLSLPVFSDRASEATTLIHTPDTVHITEHIKDTVYLSQVVEKEKIVEKIKYVRQPSDASSQVSSSVLNDSHKERELSQQEAPTCTSIQCDGINYSLLVSH